MPLSLFFHVVLYYGLLARAQSLLQVPLIPLAVKTPHLNAWFPNSANAPAGEWPRFFTNDKVSVLRVFCTKTLTLSIETDVGFVGPGGWAGVSVDGNGIQLVEDSDEHDHPNKKYLQDRGRPDSI